MKEAERRCRDLKIAAFFDMTRCGQKEKTPVSLSDPKTDRHNKEADKAGSELFMDGKVTY